MAFRSDRSYFACVFISSCTRQLQHSILSGFSLRQELLDLFLFAAVSPDKGNSAGFSLRQELLRTFRLRYQVFFSKLFASFEVTSASTLNLSGFSLRQELLDLFFIYSCQPRQGELSWLFAQSGATQHLSLALLGLFFNAVRLLEVTSASIINLYYGLTLNKKSLTNFHISNL